MIDNKTIIIVGAGAGQEVHMPTGNELKHKISNLLCYRDDDEVTKQLYGDKLIFRALSNISAKTENPTDELNSYLQSAKVISDAMPQALSIDNFIDTHTNNKRIETCGKLAIVRAILEAENNSLIYFNENKNAHPDFNKLENTWFNSFFQLLTENCNVRDLHNRLSDITLIIFNYDRCIEHFLFHSLQNYYYIDEKKSAELLNLINIFHPYGVVGNLPWQNKRESIQYGGEPSQQHLINLSQKIRTFSEGTDPRSSEIISIHRNIHEADLIVFLGFAFHKLNMDLLRPVEHDVGSCERKGFFATALKISDHDCDIIRGDIEQISPGKAVFIYIRNDLTCYKLFKEYWRSLSLS